MVKMSYFWGASCSPRQPNLTSEEQAGEIGGPTMGKRERERDEKRGDGQNCATSEGQAAVPSFWGASRRESEGERGPQWASGEAKREEKIMVKTVLILRGMLRSQAILLLRSKQERERGPRWARGEEKRWEDGQNCAAANSFVTCFAS